MEIASQQDPLCGSSAGEGGVSFVLPPNKRDIGPLRQVVCLYHLLPHTGVVNLVSEKKVPSALLNIHTQSTELCMFVTQLEMTIQKVAMRHEEKQR